MLTYVDESRFLAGWYGYSLRSKRGGMDIPCILMNKNDLPYRRDRDSLDFLYPRASQTCPRAYGPSGLRPSGRSGCPSGKENPGCNAAKPRQIFGPFSQSILPVKLLSDPNPLEFFTPSLTACALVTGLLEG